MVGAIVVSVCGGSVRVANGLFLIGQAVVGCMMAATITPAIVGSLMRNWPLFLGGVVSVIVVSSILGGMLAMARVLPGTTAIWGTSPGAATAMTLMAEASGADMRLVAFMQYVRVVFVAVVASGVARFSTGSAPGTVAAIVWFPPVAWGAFAATIALAGVSTAVAPLLRIPAGSMLAAFIVGAVLHATGLMTIELPQWLLAGSYALVGWTIGLRFTRPILVHVARLLPRIAASTLALIAICGGLGMVLSRLAGIDPLTAYLAMSPGGADSVAIIAASTPVDMPFVMALQTARFILVMFIGPGMAKLVARHFDP
jgi:membrane AbrB-like protein